MQGLSLYFHSDVLVGTASGFRETYGWINLILTGISLGLLTYFLPTHLNGNLTYSNCFWDSCRSNDFRATHAYVSLLIFAVSILQFRSAVRMGRDPYIHCSIHHLNHCGRSHFAIMDTTQQHIQRLKTINNVSCRSCYRWRLNRLFPS
jgi:hypothetical protein